MTIVSNQDSQGAAPVIAPAATSVPVTPAVVAPAPNASTPEAAQALAQGQVPPAVTATPEPLITPAAPTIGEPAKAESAPLEAETGAAGVIYAPTGDAGMDIALAFVGKLGLEPNDPAMIKAGEGDFSYLEAKLAALGDKALGWQQHVELAKNSYNSAVKTAQANAATITSAVHETAGGEDAWATLQGWAKETATDAEKIQVNKMLNESPVSARAAVIMLQQLYNQAGGTTVTPANPLKGAVPAGGAVTDANAPLSPREYTKALDKLSRERGVDAINNGSPEYRALQQRAARFTRS